MIRRRHFVMGLAGLVLLSGAGLHWLVATEAGLQFLWGRAQQWSPAPLAGEVRGRLSGPLRVRGFALELRGARVEAAAADLDWKPSALLRGRIQFTRVALRDLVVSVKQSDADGASPSPVPGVPHFPLLLDVQGVVQGLTVRREKARELRFERLALNAVAGPHRLKVRALSLDGYGWHLDTHGQVALQLDGEVQLTTRWSYQPLAGERLRGHGEVTGTLSRPQADQLFDAVVRGGAKGSLIWLDEPLRWEAEINVQPFDLTRIDRNWRPLIVGGRLQADGGANGLRAQAHGELNDPQLGSWNVEAQAVRDAQGWRIPALTLAAREGAARLLAAGVLPVEETAEMSLTMEWRDLAWPLGGSVPAVASPNGRVVLTGSLAGYRLTGQLRLSRAGMPDGVVDLDGQGDRSGLFLSRLRAAWLNGELVGSGRVQWRPFLSWSADLLARDIDPGGWRAGWNGRLAGRVSSRGDRRDDALTAELSVSEIAGELRSQRIAGEAHVALKRGNIRLETLSLQSGTARLSAQGEVGNHWDLDFLLDAARMEDLVPGLSGKAKIEGQLQGPSGTPRLRANGSAENLVWNERRVAHATLIADLDLAGAVPWDLRLEATEIRSGRHTVEHLAVSGAGGPAGHHLAFDAAFDGRTMHFAIQGAYDKRRWRGELLAGRLEDPLLGIWTQAAAAPLTLAPGAAHLDPWCLSREEARLCLAVDGDTARGWRGETSLQAFPVAALQELLLNRDLQIDGRLDGRAWVHIQDGLKALDADLAASDGVFRFQMSERELIATPYRRVELKGHANEQGLVASALLQLANGDYARGEFALPRWRPGQDFAEQPIRGSAEMALGELVWVSLLVPDLVATGRLQGNFQVGGTLSRPALEGDAALVDGEVAVPLLGIALSEIQLEADAEEDGIMAFNVRARSGPGRVSVNGRLGSDAEGRTLDLAINGQNVEVARLPHAQMLASPELQASVRGRVIRLSGLLSIPKARIDLPQIEAPVQASPDVVLVDRPEAARPAPRFTVISEVSVRFGEDVRLSGYGFSGRLAGQILVVEPAGGGAVGRGALQIFDGKYEAYGQELAIDEGRLLYGNSPLNNPGIEFRAVRQIPDLTSARQAKVVGIVATGRLKKPEVRLYSDPVMDDTDVLAYLVLGRALNTASREETDLLQRTALSFGIGTDEARQVANRVGVDVVNLEASTQGSETALVLGKYLSPRLYVQYAVGVLEATNAWQMHYRVGTHWTVKAESGTLQSGVDVLYTIEK